MNQKIWHKTSFVFALHLLVFSYANVSSINVSAEEKLEPWQQAEKTEVWEPVPQLISAVEGKPPSDAIVLFSGNNLDGWLGADDRPPQWPVKDGVFTVKPGSGDIRTRDSFCDIQLHIEWKTPLETAGLEGQERGNSGVFLQQRYEVQVLDSHGNKTYPNGQAASIYKQHIPLVNVTRTPREWNVYDIIFTAPHFDDNDKLQKPAYVTVLHNGVLVQNHVEIQGPTAWIGHPPYEAHGCAPIQLQDHGNPVSFRNVWVRKLHFW